MSEPNVPPLLYNRARAADDGGSTLPGAPDPPDATAMVLPSWLSYSAYTTAIHTRTKTTTEIIVYSDGTRGPTERTPVVTRTYTTPEYSVVYNPLPYTGPTPAPPLGGLFTIPHEDGKQHSSSQDSSKSWSRASFGASDSHEASRHRASLATPSPASHSASTRHHNSFTPRPSSLSHHLHSSDDHSSKASTHHHNHSSDSHSTSEGHSAPHHGDHRGSAKSNSHSAPYSSAQSASRYSASTSSDDATERSDQPKSTLRHTSSREHSSFGASRSSSSVSHTPDPSGGFGGPGTSQTSVVDSDTNHSSAASERHDTRPTSSSHGAPTRGPSSHASSAAASLTSSSHHTGSPSSHSEPAWSHDSNIKPSSVLSTEPMTSSSTGQSSGLISSLDQSSTMPDRSSSSTSARSSLASGTSTSPSTSSSEKPSSSPQGNSDFPLLSSASADGKAAGSLANMHAGNNLQQDAGGERTLSAGQIAGIAVGSFFGAAAVLALITLLGWLCYRRRQRQRDPFGAEDRYTKSGLSTAEKMEAGEPDQPQGLTAKFKAYRAGGKGVYAAVGKPGEGGPYPTGTNGWNPSTTNPHATVAYGLHAPRNELLSTAGPRYPHEPASWSTGLTDRLGSAGRAGVGAFVGAGVGRRQSSKRFGSGSHDPNDENTNLISPQDPHHGYHPEAYTADENPYAGQPKMRTIGPNLPFGAHIAAPPQIQHVPKHEPMQSAYDPPVQTGDRLTVPGTWARGTDANRPSPLHRTGTQYTTGADTTLTHTTGPSSISSPSLDGPSRDNSRSHRPSQQLLYARLSKGPITGPGRNDVDMAHAHEHPTAAAAGSGAAVLGAGAVAGLAAGSFGFHIERNQPDARNDGSTLGVPEDNPGDETITTVRTGLTGLEDDGDVLWDGKRHSPEAHLAALTHDGQASHRAQGSHHTLQSVGSSQLGSSGSLTSRPSDCSSEGTNDTRSVHISSSRRSFDTSSSVLAASDVRTAPTRETHSTGTQADGASSIANTLGVDLGYRSSGPGRTDPHASPRRVDTDTDYPLSTTTSHQGYLSSLNSSYPSEYGSAEDPPSSLATLGTSNNSRLWGAPTNSSSGSRTSSGPARSSRSHGPVSLPSLPAEQTSIEEGQDNPQPESLNRDQDQDQDQDQDHPEQYSARDVDQDPYDPPDPSMELLSHQDLPNNGEIWNTAGAYNYGEPLDDIEERSVEQSSQAFSGRGSRMGLSRQPTIATGASVRSSLLDHTSESGSQPAWRPSPRVRMATEKANGRLSQFQDA